MSYSNTLRQWVKTGNTPLSNAICRVLVQARGTSFPVVPVLHLALYHLHRAVTNGVGATSRVLWYTPLFQARLQQRARQLYIYGGMPLVLGPVRIAFGKNVRISGQTTITGRTCNAVDPLLTVGSNVDIGWQTTIAVGRNVTIGDNVRIAGRAFLAGYPGHPIDAMARAKGLPDTDDQVRDIVIENDVWLATGVMVLAGVTIGKGTIVAAGSTVTRDLPPFVLAGGSPARVIKTLSAERSS